MKIPLIFFVFIVTTMNCTGQDPTPVNGMNMLKNSRWLSSGSSGKTIIEVNWENPYAAHATQRKWVQEAIEATWEKYSNVDFVGWGRTHNNSKGIRIQVDATAHPHVEELGIKLDGFPNGMVLTFEFLGDFKCVGRSFEECIKLIAVHEFGHALGLAHEHNRPDCFCEEEPQGTYGDFYLTPCDIESVMNYCNPKWANDGQLSDNDIAGIQMVYGKPHGTDSPFQIDELRLIPCSKSVRFKATEINDIIRDLARFNVQKFSFEDNTIPQAAIENVPKPITIRYFDQNDYSKAFGLRTLLIAEGFEKSTVAIEDMTSRMSSIANYIEIWVREDTILPTAISLDEVRFVPIQQNDELISRLQSSINAANFQVKVFTKETDIIPQKAVSRLPNKVAIRYFHPNDELKANKMKNVLSLLFASTDITVENMILRMTTVYPNYIEVWIND